MTFFCEGRPIPQGSKTIGRTREGRVFMRPAWDSKRRLPAWRKAIAQTARAHGIPCITEGPVHVGLTFYMPRGKTVKRREPCVKPDTDKLVRACLDALTGIAYTDDSQVTSLVALKWYADNRPPGVYVNVEGRST